MDVLRHYVHQVGPDDEVVEQLRRQKLDEQVGAGRGDGEWYALDKSIVLVAFAVRNQFAGDKVAVKADAFTDPARSGGGDEWMGVGIGWPGTCQGGEGADDFSGDVAPKPFLAFLFEASVVHVL